MSRLLILSFAEGSEKWSAVAEGKRKGGLPPETAWGPLTTTSPSSLLQAGICSSDCPRSSSCCPTGLEKAWRSDKEEMVVKDTWLSLGRDPLPPPFSHSWPLLQAGRARSRHLISSSNHQVQPPPSSPMPCRLERGRKQGEGALPHRKSQSSFPFAKPTRWAERHMGRFYLLCDPLVG